MACHILIDPNNCCVPFVPRRRNNVAGDVSYFMLACVSTVDMSSVHDLKIATAFPLVVPPSIRPITDVWIKFLSKFTALTTLELCIGFEFTSGFLRVFRFEGELVFGI